MWLCTLLYHCLETLPYLTTTRKHKNLSVLTTLDTICFLGRFIICVIMVNRNNTGYVSNFETVNRYRQLYSGGVIITFKYVSVFYYQLSAFFINILSIYKMFLNGLYYLVIYFLALVTCIDF